LAYDHGSIEALKPRPNGGRKHENMTLAEEEALLARFAKAAGAGEMLNIHDLKAVSTPEQKCIGWPEQKYISEAGKKAPEPGALDLGIRLGSDYPPAYPSWQGVGVACSD
jgi:hypothetical protein